MHVYRNDSPDQNTSPTAPTSLKAAGQAGSTIILSWIPASDDHTPSPAQTYDLDLFRNGIPVTIPCRFPEPSNVSAVTEWLLAGLPDGQYDWTLRAVDASYSGGPITTGQFIIGVTSVEPDVNLPQDYAFDKNYPNPFNPATTFRFALPERAHMELAVYNLRGRLVARLVD